MASGVGVVVHFLTFSLTNISGKTKMFWKKTCPEYLEVSCRFAGLAHIHTIGVESCLSCGKSGLDDSIF